MIRNKKVIAIEIRVGERGRGEGGRDGDKAKSYARLSLWASRLLVRKLTPSVWVSVT